MSEHINWIERGLKDKHIKHYEYKKFNDIKEIGSGAFGHVYRAKLKQTVFALKSFDKSIAKEIVSELSLHREVDFHENIIRFHGITTQPDSGKYLLVLEYADGGTLRNYLEENFLSLDWEDKYRLAFQLSSAIECLHDEDVAHRDLHSKNVLICGKNIKLADFGLSRRIEDTTNSGSKIFGVIPYIDPKGFSTVKKKKETASLGKKDREKYKKK